MNITVTQPAPQQVSVAVAAGVTVDVTTAKQQVSVGNFLPRQEIFISDTQPDFDIGLWVQKFADGTFQVWIEDGT